MKKKKLKKRVEELERRVERLELTAIYQFSKDIKSFKLDNHLNDLKKYKYGDRTCGTYKTEVNM